MANCIGCKPRRCGLGAAGSKLPLTAQLGCGQADPPKPPTPTHPPTCADTHTQTNTYTHAHTPPPQAFEYLSREFAALPPGAGPEAAAARLHEVARLPLAELEAHLAQLGRGSPEAKEEVGSRKRELSGVCMRVGMYRWGAAILMK